jgi:hypothetical protein
VADPISSPSLESVFGRLEVHDILAFVTEQRGEDLTLDFKLAPSNFSNREDRKTLAQAISGFANSSGGLMFGASMRGRTTTELIARSNRCLL